MNNMRTLIETVEQYVVSLTEAIDWKLPPPPGTAPIPADHVRLYHQTSAKNLGAIKHQGILFDKARGIEGPRAIWADEKGFYGDPKDTPTVEFHVHKDRWKKPWVMGDVTPDEIIAVHRNWHQRARYIENHPNAIQQVLDGEHDDLMYDPEWGSAIRYIKHKYGAKK